MKIEKTKFCRSHHQYLNNSQLKFQCLRLVGSWVIRLSLYIYIYILFLCSFADLEKNGTNNWKNTELCESYLGYLNKSEPKSKCRKWIRFLIISLKTLLYINVIFKKCPSSQPPSVLKKIFQGLKTHKKIKSFKHTKLLLLTIFFPGCSFLFKSAQKCKILSWSKFLNFWLELDGNKTRHWCHALLTTNSFDSLPGALSYTKS